MKNYTLYRVNGHTQNVNFILNADDESLNNAEMFSRLIASMITFSFDDILIQLEQFRTRYERLKIF